MFGRRELIEKLAVFLGIAVAAKANTTKPAVGREDALLAEMKAAAIAIRQDNIAEKRREPDELRKRFDSLARYVAKASPVGMTLWVRNDDVASLTFFEHHEGPLTPLDNEPADSFTRIVGTGEIFKGHYDFENRRLRKCSESHDNNA